MVRRCKSILNPDLPNCTNAYLRYSVRVCYTHLIDFEISKKRRKGCSLLFFFTIDTYYVCKQYIGTAPYIKIRIIYSSAFHTVTQTWIIYNANIIFTSLSCQVRTYLPMVCALVFFFVSPYTFFLRLPTTYLPLRL